jgi:hypothetical protein
MRTDEVETAYPNDKVSRITVSIILTGVGAKKVYVPDILLLS